MDELFESVKSELKYYDLQEVSEISGVSVGALYAWVCGKTQSPRTCNLTAVAEALGYTFSWYK